MARGIAAPIIGCSKPERVDDAVAALDVTLTEEELAFIEEPYVAHELVGPLARLVRNLSQAQPILIKITNPADKGTISH